MRRRTFFARLAGGFVAAVGLCTRNTTPPVRIAIGPFPKGIHIFDGHSWHLVNGSEYDTFDLPNNRTLRLYPR